jgi:pimeloyl-ACP methyl ester carboxylesterase
MRWKMLLATTTALAVLAPMGAAQATEAAGSQLDWGSCPPPEIDVVPDPRLQCASLRVPLDYRHPRGRQIVITISRIAAADPALRRGVLLVNPGGPGVPGLVVVPTRLAAMLPADVLDRYDLIGMDPRGVGRSTPISCGITMVGNETLILPYPAPDGSIARNVAFARTTARSCAAHSGDLLPAITTANTARDMDRVRVALGEDKVSLYGFSYGTYLDQVYASLFTGRTERVILDSTVDPTRVWAGFWPRLSAATDLRMPDFTEWAARHDGVFGLGDTSAAVRHTFDLVAAKLDRSPVFVAEFARTVDGNLFREVTRSSLYNDVNFPLLAQFWQLLAQPDASGVAAAGRSKLQDLLRGAAPQGSGVPADNEAAVLYAIVCGDARWPLPPSDHARAVAADRRAYPITAGMPANIWPCAFWPFAPVEPPVTITRTGPRNILILQNRRDPATSWESGQAARNALGARAVMVSVDAGDHGVYRITGGPCADEIATAFLISGTLPAADVSCPGPASQDVS